MANTITKGDHTINILFDGATAWDPIADYPAGLCVESLEMKPTATDDLISVREDDASGISFFNEKAATAYDNKIKYFNTEKSEKRFRLYIVGNEVSTGVILIIELK